MKVICYNAITRPLYRVNGDVYQVEVEGRIFGEYRGTFFSVHCDFYLNWEATEPVSIENITAAVKAEITKATADDRQAEIDHLCDVTRFTAWQGKRGLYNSGVSFFLPETASDAILLERGRCIIDGLADDKVNFNFNDDKNDCVVTEGDDVIVDIASWNLKVTFVGGLTQDRLTYFIEHISEFVAGEFDYEGVIVDYPGISEIDSFTCEPLTHVVELGRAFLQGRPVTVNCKKVL